MAWTSEELLVVVGGGAAGVYGAIRAKTLAPNLNVVVIEKGKPLSKVKISGGGRCNVTNGRCVDNKMLAENYPRGHKELRGAFFNVHGPVDTMSWFSEHGVRLKIEDDGRVFPVSNSSSTIIDCLMSESTRLGVSLQTGKAVITASPTAGGKFLLGIEKRTFSSPEYVEADYLLIASGNSKQGYSLASQLGHSIVDPVPSLFTFKIEDPRLADLSGITFPKVKATLKIENARRNIPQLTQACWTCVGHALGIQWACNSSHLDAGTLIVDFTPDVHIEHLKSILTQHKNWFAGLLGDTLWASISKNSLISLAHMLKHCNFYVTGKSQYKDEFVTAGGVPLSEISMNTMESKIQSHLFFAGEVLNVDGITGGFNFQNAWSGGYIAGTSIGKQAVDGPDEEAAADGYERPDNTVLNVKTPLVFFT
ncbi:FAD/NAD(P)-binding oxidoreductase family protein [Prunus dulcis]|uniref:FAD/NAD(P)-binding oxidoreductase family protein n=1 Tax=Prunus dulcis TaxID=3755 RepID=A0A4Y1R8S7_PRUDU|nr:FAD/NAD(P)-binding oxidoreductase family protein [Prunus dulcis]